MYLHDNETGLLIEVEIVAAVFSDMPLKKDGWSFSWRSIVKRKGTDTYVLRLKSNPSSIQGVLHLRVHEGMLIMDLVEIAPQNIGRQSKRYSYVAGCLIAFACRESYKLESSYKGFLTFESKTKLVSWYSDNYYAIVAMGQKMYIEPVDSAKLIDRYLKRTK
ncbi:hypothetical protein N8482_01800 [Chitinophagales bacterium]|nr:hypothetical protein [Chitinophagales bacterium]